MGRNDPINQAVEEEPLLPGLLLNLLVSVLTHASLSSPAPNEPLGTSSSKRSRGRTRASDSPWGRRSRKHW